MSYTIEQLKLAHERGARLEYKDRDSDDWSDVIVPWFSDKTDYRLKNPERDRHLTLFNLHPFDLERALAGDELIARDGRPVFNLRTSFDVNSHEYPFLADVGEFKTAHGFTSSGLFFDNGEEYVLDLFMKYPSKQEAEKEKQAEPEQKLEPWQIILASYGREIRHAEWTAKYLSGIELEMFNRDSKSWYIPAYTPCDYPKHVKFREKQKKVTVSSWCIDIRGEDMVSIFTYESKHKAELALEELKSDGYEVLSEPYFKEYTIEV